MLSAFVWSGPQLNPKKTKVAWDIVCRTRREGGLGLCLLSDMNNVGCLKIVWRVISNQSSLWVKWVYHYLLRGSSFGYIHDTTTRGSWMWKKLLKTRGLARNFHKSEVNNGENNFFWYDCWSSFGCLLDKLGPREVIDLGVPLNSRVASVWVTRRRRRHRVEVLERIEDELKALRVRSQHVVLDNHLWKCKENKYRSTFSSKHTFNLLRRENPRVPWFSGIWFTHYTPKFSMFLWLAIHHILSTGDQMASWNVGARVSCVLCGCLMETQQHLFFSCEYSAKVWNDTTRGLLGNRFTTDWYHLLHIIADKTVELVTLFFTRYAFQATVYYLWRERNGRRHRDLPIPAAVMVKMLDKQVRNRCSTISDPKLQGSIQLLFSTRISQS